MTTVPDYRNPRFYPINRLPYPKHRYHTSNMPATDEHPGPPLSHTSTGSLSLSLRDSNNLNIGTSDLWFSMSLSSVSSILLRYPLSLNANYKTSVMRFLCPILFVINITRLVVIVAINSAKSDVTVIVKCHLFLPVVRVAPLSANKRPVIFSDSLSISRVL